MSSPFGEMRIIVNPRAGRGAVGRALPPLERALEARGLAYHVARTEGPGHAIRLAREALESGTRFVVAVGGDGTVHEVVNGMMADDGPVNPDAVLGVVAAGSGCDFARTFDLPRDFERIAEYLGGTKTRRIDVGRVRFVDKAGAQGARWFPNIADVGYGSESTALAQRLPRSLGRAVYLIAAWATLARFRPERVTITMDSDTYEGKMNHLAVANCKFFGGGMKVAPNAIPDDGLLDVSVFDGHRSDMIFKAHKIFKGSHVPHPNIREYRSVRVEIKAASPMLVEADGEILGYTPAVFDLVPNALTLKV
ncbi:MAG: diacylglycerol kinase family protein [Actinomycetota bacterium]